MVHTTIALLPMSMNMTMTKHGLKSKSLRINSNHALRNRLKLIAQVTESIHAFLVHSPIERIPHLHDDSATALKLRNVFEDSFVTISIFVTKNKFLGRHTRTRHKDVFRIPEDAAKNTFSRSIEWITIQNAQKDVKRTRTFTNIVEDGNFLSVI